MPDKDQQAQIDALAKRVDDLASREEIRECLYRINRGIDRIDADLLASGFFSDAKIRWGTPDYASREDWIKAAIAMQHKTQRAQHLIGNMLIDIDGNRAYVEAAEIGRHLTPLGPTEMKDLVIAARYIDIFERRDGVWRIVQRDKVCDWIRILEGTDPLYEHSPLAGKRDATDISYQVFGNKPFHSLI